MINFSAKVQKTHLELTSRSRDFRHHKIGSKTDTQDLITYKTENDNPLWDMRSYQQNENNTQS